MAEYLEYATDKPKDGVIPKLERNLQVQIERAAKNVRPERLRNLLLHEANFRIDGNEGIFKVYDERSMGLGVFVETRHANGQKKVRVPMEFVGPIKVDKNYSMRSAHTSQLAPNIVNSAFEALPIVEC